MNRTARPPATPSGSTTHLVRTLGLVTLADGTVIKTAGYRTLCMNCHQARQNATKYAATAAGSAHFPPNEGPQADMLVGTNGSTYGKAIPSSAYSNVQPILASLATWSDRLPAIRR